MSHIYADYRRLENVDLVGRSVHWTQSVYVWLVLRSWPWGILVDMILRQDRCVYRETTADSSTKPRWIVDFLIVIEQGLLI